MCGTGQLPGPRNVGLGVRKLILMSGAARRTQGPQNLNVEPGSGEVEPDRGSWGFESWPEHWKALPGGFRVPAQDRGSNLAGQRRPQPLQVSPQSELSDTVNRRYLPTHRRAPLRSVTKRSQE
jgi:hypothetical protein